MCMDLPKCNDLFSIMDTAAAISTGLHVMAQAADSGAANTLQMAILTG